MPNMDEWRASLTEYRIAWITALCSIALILLVSAWPELFTITPKQPEAKAPPAKEKPVATKPAPQQQPKTPSTPAPEEKAALERVIEEATPAPIEPQAKPTAPTKKPEPKPAAAAAGYYVQTGAFKDAAAAREIAAKLGRQGWPAIVVPKNGLHAVWAGPRQSRNAIEKLQQEILRDLKIKGFIVQKK